MVSLRVLSRITHQGEPEPVEGDTLLQEIFAAPMDKMVVLEVELLVSSQRLLELWVRGSPRWGMMEELEPFVEQGVAEVLQRLVLTRQKTLEAMVGQAHLPR